MAGFVAKLPVAVVIILDHNNVRGLL